MKKRKQYIIDKKFQLKTTFSIIGAVSIITAIIIIAIAASVVYNNNRINNIHEIEDNIVHFLTSSTSSGDDPVYQQAIRKLALDHSKNRDTLREIMYYNKILLIVLLILIVSETVILYIMLIRKTHKISGPIYVMSNYIRDIINGKYPEVRGLREKDELKDFYLLFKEMVDTLKAKEKQ